MFLSVQLRTSLDVEYLDFRSAPAEDGRANGCPHLVSIKWCISYVLDHWDVIHYRLHHNLPDGTWKRRCVDGPFVDWHKGNRFNNFEDDQCDKEEDESEEGDLAARGLWDEE